MAIDKNQILGMSFSSARSRLERDVMFKLANDAGHVCFRCGKPMTRDDFSIEHTVLWSSAPNPKEVYFDLSKIAFSHHTCNAGVRTNCKEHTYNRGCRCEKCKEDKRNRRGVYDPTKRQERYMKYGT